MREWLWTCGRPRPARPVSTPTMRGHVARRPRPQRLRALRDCHAAAAQAESGPDEATTEGVELGGGDTTPLRGDAGLSDSEEEGLDEGEGGAEGAPGVRACESFRNPRKARDPAPAGAWGRLGPAPEAEGRMMGLSACLWWGRAGSGPGIRASAGAVQIIW